MRSTGRVKIVARRRQSEAGGPRRYVIQHAPRITWTVTLNTFDKEDNLVEEEYLGYVDGDEGHRGRYLPPVRTYRFDTEEEARDSAQAWVEGR